MRTRTCMFITATIGLVGLFLGCSDDATGPDNGEPRQLGWAVGGSVDYGTILHSTDGGNTWIQQGDSLQFSTMNFNDICIINKHTLLVVGGSADGSLSVLKSVDGGDTWNVSGSTDLETVAYNAIFALDENNIWIVGDEGSIYYSTDMASSWTKIGLPAEYQPYDLYRIVATNRDDIWVGCQEAANDSFPPMLHTTDGGGNWERLDPLGDLGIDPIADTYLGVKIFGSSIWAIGGKGRFIVRSSDSGATWEDITVPGTGGFYDANDIFLLGETEAYVVQDFGLVFSTSDGGLNWTQYYPNAAGTWVLGVAILNDVDIWICGSAAGGGETSIIKYSSDAGTTWQDQTPELLIDNPHIALYKIRFIEAD